jgi:hypothetical protein
MADNCRNPTNLIRKKPMKKSELKNIIKECVKEVIFEEGVLSGIITEVAHGLQGASILQESAPPPPPSARNSRQVTPSGESKKQVLAAIAAQSYEEAKKKFNNPALFEGTAPIPTDSGAGALAGVSAGDQGVDISNIPGFSNWGSVANGLK